MFFNKQEPPIVVSVGGSLIVPPTGVDTEFLKKLNTFIRAEVEKGKRFFLVAGGGMSTRHYQDAARKVDHDITHEDLDWIGIHATRMNAHLLRTIFQDIAHARIIENYEKRLFGWKESVVIGAGWKPGWSTDYCTVIMARDYGAKLIVNMSNIDYVYDKDPNIFPDAKKIEKMRWEELGKLVGDKWVPGSNMPFDPIATKLAKKLALTVIIANGKNFANIQNIVEYKPFQGTTISP